MKTKSLFIVCILAATTIFTGCNSKKSKQYEEAQVEIESLKSQIQQQENEMNTIFDAINDIEENLLQITSRYQTIEKIKKTDVERSKDARTDITNQINEINQLLEENKNRINTLTSRLGSSDSKLKEANAFVSRLEARIKEQDTQINNLRNELEQRKILIGTLNENVKSLEKSNQEKDQMITDRTQEVNTAYYAIGIEKDLINNDIIDKQGRRRTISLDANPSYFNKIDIRNTTTIPINAKKAELISQHPENSYEFVKMDKNVDALRIKDANEFWKLTRYLIIKIK